MTNAFPGIGFRGSGARRRAWVIGSGLDVWEIVEAYRDLGASIERTLAETDIEEGHLRLALAYYERFPEEINEAIAENTATARDFAARFPSFTVTPGSLAAEAEAVAADPADRAEKEEITRQMDDLAPEDPPP